MMLRTSVLLGCLVLAVLTAVASAQADTRSWTVGFGTDGTDGTERFPRRFTEDSGGRLVLWASGKHSRKYAFTSGAGRPHVVRRAPVGDEFESPSPLAVNNRGAMLRAAFVGSRHARVIFEDERGVRQDLRPRAPGSASLKSVVVAVGADGTAAVAWTATGYSDSDPRGTLSVQIREPGERFSAATIVQRGAEMSSAAVGVAPDGTVEIAYTQAGRDALGTIRVLFIERRAGGTFTEPETAVDRLTHEAQFPTLVAGGLGRSRIIYDSTTPDDGIESVLRTSAGGWTAPQRLSRPARADRRIVVLPNGGAAFIAVDDEVLAVRRALPGQPFGDPQPLARNRPRWQILSPRIFSAGDGGLIAGWTEGQQEQLGVNFGPEGCFPCHTRVLAAVAPAGGPFEEAAAVAPLGTYVDPNFTQVGLSRSGRPAAAWLTVDDSASVPGRLAVAFGSRRPVRTRPSDQSRLGVFATASRAHVRAARNGAPVPVRVRCTKPCDLRVALIDAGVDEDDERFPMTEFAAARTVLGARVPGAVKLRVPRGQRRALGRRLKSGDLRLRVSAVDGGGTAYKRWQRLR